jgi:hypothetical protein
MPRPLLLLAVGVALSLTAAGCNGSDSDDDSGEPAADTSGSDPNTPAGTVVRLWREIQGGSPTMVLRYHPRIRRAVGSSGILAVFQPPAPVFGGEPRVLSVNSTPLGEQVIVRSRSQDGKQRFTSVYLLEKRGDRWVVRFDNNLNGAVEAYVTRKAQVRLNADARRPSAEAADAGERAATELRSLFVPGPRNGPLVRP